MMQKMEKKTCSCCGMGEFETLDANHVKCSYCDTVYYIEDNNKEVTPEVDKYCNYDEEFMQKVYENFQAIDDAEKKRQTNNENKRIRRFTIVMILVIAICFILYRTTGNFTFGGVAVFCLGITYLFRKMHKMERV